MPPFKLLFSILHSTYCTVGLSTHNKISVILDKSGQYRYIRLGGNARLVDTQHFKYKADKCTVKYFAYSFALVFPDEKPSSLSLTMSSCMLL